MPIEVIQCYIARCDGCGEEVEDGDGYRPHFSTHGDAQTNASESEWTEIEGFLWCPDCPVPPCVCGHLFGEHDYGEAGCEDCDCGEFILTGKEG